MKPILSRPQTNARGEGLRRGEGMFAVVVFLMVCLAPSSSQAVEPLSDSSFGKVWDADLGSSTVMSIVQDHTGFLWIATQGGLVRYDGYSFRAFRYDQNDPRSIDDDFVRALHIDSSGGLWVGTATGVCRYDPATSEFVRFSRPSSNIDELLGVSSIADHGAEILIATDRGLFRIDPATQLIVPYLDPAAGDQMLEPVSYVLSGRDETIWAGTRNALHSKRAQEGFEVSLRARSDEILVGLFEDRTGRIWVRWSDGEIDIIDPASRAVRRARVGASATLAGMHRSWVAIVQPNEEEIWVGTDTSIVILEATSGREKVTIPMTRGAVYALFVDDSGVVWAGIPGQGLVRYVPPNPAFSLVSDGLEVKGVGAVAEVDGEIWIGTRGGGISIWDPVDGDVRHLDISRLTEPVNDGVVRDILPVQDSVWVATNISGVLRFDRRGTLKHWFSAAEGLPSNQIFSLALDSQGRVLVGTQDRGLGIIEPESDAVGTAPYFNDPSEDWRAAPILDVVVDSHGAVYLATATGGLRKSSSDGAVTLFAHDPADPASISHNGVMTLLLDSRERLWVGTRYGLNLLIPAADGPATFRRFGLDEGLPAAFVDGLLEGRDGDIWVATDRGLARLDADTFQVSVFDHQSAVPGGGFWVAAHATASDGTLMFAAKEGLLRVGPEVTPWTYRPRIAVSEVQVDGRAQPGAGWNQIVLRPEQRDFSVEFTALDLSDPERNRYAFRLEGYDESFFETDASHRIATYTNLDPGSYTLQVKGSNRSGLWSDHELNLAVLVQPTFFETVWFDALLATSILLTFCAGYLWRIRTLNATELALQQLVEQRTVELGQRTAELEQANRRLERSSNTDFLTDLHNRRAITAVANTEIKRWLRSRQPLSIAMCDVDEFRNFNNKYGHDAGDFVLQSVARFFREQIREADRVARWGGEEFFFLFLDTDAAGARVAADKVRAQLAEQRWVFEGNELALTATFGVCQLADGMDLETCVKRADEALYRGKKEGRNRVLVGG